MNLDKIAKDISKLENMPNDEEYFNTCILVAEDLYNLNHDDAYTVANIIQEKYLE